MQVAPINTSYSYNQVAAPEVSRPISQQAADGIPIREKDIMLWLHENKATIVSDPESMEKKLNQQLSLMVDDNGKKVVTSATNRFMAAVNIQALAQSDGLTELDDFFDQFQSHLILYMSVQGSILQSIINPTLENGGVVLDYDDQ